jgi:hypothetical protein
MRRIKKKVKSTTEAIDIFVILFSVTFSTVYQDCLTGKNIHTNFVIPVKTGMRN